MAEYNVQKNDIPKKYTVLRKYCSPVFQPKRKTLGREKEIEEIKESLLRPEYSNVILLGNAGSGKTAIVSELSKEDHTRSYYEVDLDRMASSKGAGGGSGSVEMASRMKILMKQVVEYQQEASKEARDEAANNGKKRSDVPDKEIVLFMDEFHLIEKVSSAAAQAIKPMLARSGALHIRVIAATTYEEFDRYIKPDEALTERLQPVQVTPTDDHTTFKILQSMKKMYVPDVPVSPEMFHHIIRITNKYMLGKSQPRKSIKVFDAMIGAYRETHQPMDEKMLKNIMMTRYGIRVDWDFDVNNIEDYLDGRIIDQQDASAILAQQLYISVAGLSDPTRPQGSFLFTGSTGVGKTEMAKQLTKILLGNENDMIRFDMANFALNSSLPIFKNELTARVANHSNYVILLDEIEKAGPAITRMLLPVLDDGELADQYGRTVSFRNAYIIMTTNAAQSIYKKINSTIDKSAKKQQKKRGGDWAAPFRRLIRRALIHDKDFPTELVNRLDAFIPFKPLSPAALRQIAYMYLQEIYNVVYNKYRIRLHIQSDDYTKYFDAKDGTKHKFVDTAANRLEIKRNPSLQWPYKDGVLSYLVDEQRDESTDAGGGRGVKNNINHSIKAGVAQLICQDPTIHDIAVDVKGDMAINRPNHRLGDAYIKVSPWTPEAVQPNSRTYLKGNFRRHTA